MKPARDITVAQLLSQVIILILLLVVIFPRVFFYGELASSADILFLIKPWSEYAPPGFERVQNQLMFDPVMAFRPDYLLTKQAIESGEWPLWNPLELGGVPLLANCQSTVFYPLRLLLLAMDVDTAMTVFVLLKLLLCGITAFICARWIGLGLAASRFFSVAWMMGSYNLIWANWPLVDVSAWAPILFAGAEFILNGRYRRGLAAMSLGATLILYAGHPETAFTLSMGVGVYFAARLVFDQCGEQTGESRISAYTWRPIVRAITSIGTWKRAGIATMAWAIALLAYTPQLLPFVEFLTNSYTWSDRHEKEHILISYSAGSAASLWVPRYFGTGAEQNFWDQEKWNSNITAKQYPGMVIWCALALLLARVPKDSPLRKRNVQVAALLVAALAGFLLAYHVWPISLVRKLPVFSSMLDIYHICFTLFAWPLLGAISIERWLSRKRRLRELYPIVGVMLFGAIVVYFVNRFNEPLLAMLVRKEHPGLYDYIRVQIYIAIGFAATASLVFSISCFYRRPEIIWILAGVVFVIDHAVAVRGLNPTMPRALVYPETELTRFLRTLPHPSRVGVAQASIYNGAIANYGVEEWVGYDGLFPERVIRYQSELKSTVWDAMEPAQAIDYYVSDPDPRYEPAFPWKEMLASGRIERVGNFDTLDVFRNNGALPRAFLAPTLEVIPERDALLEVMSTKGFDPSERAVTEVRPGSPIPNATARPVGTVEMNTHRSTFVQVTYETREDAVLVLADAYYPGWNAYLDESPIEMFPVYYMFRGIIVPPGRHVVEYRYEPAPLEIGLIVSSATLLASALASAFLLLRMRQSRSIAK
ncbi:MAG: YfhO family protein [Candidatus Hydrogenedentes bacterium]|nr:YfhO family protein [Candidatus Hydrogenedentota bacterium]